MKVVMTLLARDEADVLDKQLRFHLEHGVDFVVATDHGSTDGTTEILRRYERERHLHLIRETAEQRRQSEWVTRMARLAATDFGADWVINSDADEFWWGRDGPLQVLLAAVPPRYGIVRGLWRHFVARPETDQPFYERMTIRRRPSTDGGTPYYAERKLAHRADPDVVVRMGNHDVVGRGLLVLREWFPFDVLHFPVRSTAQMERKYLAREPELRDASSSVGAHVRAAATAIRAEGVEAVYRRLMVDDDALAAGLTKGILAIDTRLRDVLSGAQFGPALEGRAGLIEELDALQRIDASVRLAERLDWLERRLAAAEAAGVMRRAASAVRRFRASRRERASASPSPRARRSR